MNLNTASGTNQQTIDTKKKGGFILSDPLLLIPLALAAVLVIFLLLR